MKPNRLKGEVNITKLKPLQIGNLTAQVPIIQGGMGIGISLSSLAGAVAKEGGIGVISAAQPGYYDPEWKKHPLEANLRCLGNHIRQSKQISNGGIIGVNIMRASKNYDQYVQCCIDNGADIIISGAGLPMDLPKLIGNADIKYAPIVSSDKAASLLMRLWNKRGERMPDFVVIEGPKAGGHLGFSMEELCDEEAENYDIQVKAIIACVKSYEEKYGRTFPVVFAGGVWNREDIDHYLGLGCDGVQMASRFVATEECDANIKYKEAYINAKQEDIMLVKSPVGMPGRAIRNGYMTKMETEKEQITRCFRCLEKCDPATAPYCITAALIRAAEGDVENSLVFCGENAYKADKITTVKQIFDELNL